MFLKCLQNSQKNIFAGISFLIKSQAGNLKLSEAATGQPMVSKIRPEAVVVSYSVKKVH